MLSKLRVQNFKCFRDTGDLQIRPLTLLVGPNSSGKSSLLQMLLMLRQTIDSKDFDSPLLANSTWVQMGTYSDFIYRGELKRRLLVSTEFSYIGADPKVKEGAQKPTKVSLTAIFNYNQRTTQIELRESDIRFDGTELKLKKARGKKYKARVRYELGQKRKDWTSDEVSPMRFFGFAPPTTKKEKGFDIDTAPFVPVSFLAVSITVAFRQLYYLGPLRDLPRRFYVTSGGTPDDVGVRGERAADVFWFSHWSEAKRIREIKRKVRQWLKKFDIASDIRLDRLGEKQNYYRIIITDPATGMETSLADVGFGVSQILPIIIESFYVPPRSTILIEQPEIHLHPKAQSVLGDLFIEAVRDGNRTFVVETHSEHILARIRRRIAEGKVDKEKVAIYYFQPTAEGTRIQEVTLNEKGQYKEFPEGFFEEDVIEAFEHLKAMKRKQRK